jgi:lipopolysaccharide/colanic/teichoic acid biosynthesis glycosyltransferase
MKQTLWFGRMAPREYLLRGSAYGIAKRIMDLMIVLLTSPLWLLLLGVCALLIKLDSLYEPVFFVQERTGKGGRRFRMYKFRTLKVTAERRSLFGPVKPLKNPHATRIGHVLRRSSLDELPQIANVLRGEMSLVGPRPTSFSTEVYALWQTERLDVQPGMTGLWQIVGRGSEDFAKRVRLDIAYIEHRCLWLDVKILVYTLPMVLLQRGAY